MATDFIRVAQGNFITESGPVAELQWNGWDLRIVGGRIYTETKAAYGFAKSFRLEDGELGLYRGMDRRYSYFRTDRFQKFLDRFGIDRVVPKDPTGMIFDTVLESTHTYLNYCGLVTNNAPYRIDSRGEKVPYVGTSEKTVPEGAKWAVFFRSKDYMSSPPAHTQLVTMLNPLNLEADFEEILGELGAERFLDLVGVWKEKTRR